jgi:hypothetical protein
MNRAELCRVLAELPHGGEFTELDAWVIVRDSRAAR